MTVTEDRRAAPVAAGPAGRRGGAGPARRSRVARRLGPVVAGIAGISAIGLAVMGGGSGIVALPVAVVAALVVVLLSRRPRRGRAEPAWDGSSALAATAPAPAARRAAPATAQQVAFALGRVEARELASTPWFGMGIGFLTVVVLALVVLFPQDNGSSWAEAFSLVPVLVHPLVGMVVLASHRAVTRGGRDGAAELFDTCPASATTRTVGVLATAWVPVVAALAFVAVLAAGLAVRSPYLHGSIGLAALVAVLAAATLCVGGVALGVALGRWVGFALAPVAVVVAVGFGSARLQTAGDPGFSPLRLLSTTPLTSETADLLPDPPAWPNLGWLVGLTLVTAVVALARDHRGRGLGVVAAAAGLLVVGSGVATTRPVPADRAAHVADLIANVAAHQSCAATAGPVDVCVYTSSELGDRVRAEVAPVAAALPAGATRITLRQGYAGRLDALPPGVVRRLPQGVPPPGPNEARLGFDFAPAERRVPRMQLAFAAAGLPVEPDEGDRPVVVAGQARGAVALWLATRGLDAEDARRFTSARYGQSGPVGEQDAFDRGYVDWPSYCGVTPVVWSAQDLAAARSLVAAPEAAVRSVVHGGWERWRDPGTSTDELLAALGLPPVGPAEVVETREESTC